MLVENYGFPYSEEYISSLESENIKLLTEEYLQLSYMSGTEAEEKKENKNSINNIIQKRKIQAAFLHDR